MPSPSSRIAKSAPGVLYGSSGGENESSSGATVGVASANGINDGRTVIDGDGVDGLAAFALISVAIDNALIMDNNVKEVIFVLKVTGSLL
mmetsp:Transcript_17122/g.39533  ORF Transcript_17122/g.39533 Transcript_17122/m.39533 type:complete len:90 (-) Transcript_17122:25-294(-)